MAALPRREPSVTASVAVSPAGEPEAIFVVGVSRSGTTLMRTLLERSERIAIAMENHYLGHLIPGYGAREMFRPLGDLADDATIRKIVDFIYSGDYQRKSRWREISPFWRWLISDVPRAQVEQRLLAAERNERGVFVALLRLYADHYGKQIVGEKTPAHIRFGELIFDWFPSARMIHMVRDPRAVYVSEVRRRLKRPSAPYSWLMHVPLLFQFVMLVQVARTWRAAARRDRELAKKFPGRYLMIRFEDLVREPHDVLARIYQFLNVAMPPDAAAVTVVSRGFNLGSEGLDAGAADRWQTQIHPLARRLRARLTAGPLRALGYAP
jgi:hypothetical protein